MEVVRCCPLTCLGVHRKVWLAVKNAVDDSCAVAICGVICISSRHLCHIGSWTNTYTQVMLL